MEGVKHPSHGRLAANRCVVICLKAISLTENDRLELQDASTLTSSTNDVKSNTALLENLLLKYARVLPIDDEEGMKTSTEAAYYFLEYGVAERLMVIVRTLAAKGEERSGFSTSDVTCLNMCLLLLAAIARGRERGRGFDETLQDVVHSIIEVARLAEDNTLLGNCAWCLMSLLESGPCVINDFSDMLNEMFNVFTEEITKLERCYLVDCMSCFMSATNIIHCVRFVAKMQFHDVMTSHHTQALIRIIGRTLNLQSVKCSALVVAVLDILFKLSMKENNLRELVERDDFLLPLARLCASDDLKIQIKANDTVGNILCDDVFRIAVSPFIPTIIHVLSCSGDTTVCCRILWQVSSLAPKFMSFLFQSQVWPLVGSSISLAPVELEKEGFLAIESVFSDCTDEEKQKLVLDKTQVVEAILLKYLWRYENNFKSFIMIDLLIEILKLLEDALTQSPDSQQESSEKKCATAVAGLFREYKTMEVSANLGSNFRNGPELRAHLEKVMSLIPESESF